MKKSTKLAVGILLAVTCLALAVTGSFAAYTRTRYAKRVVTTKAGTGGMPFSSNYLDPISNPEDPTYSEKTFNVGNGTGLSIPLTICNYPRNKIAKFSSTNITYNLIIELNGTETVPDDLKANLKINGTPLSSWDSEASHALPGGSSHLDQYQITCDASYIEALSKYTIRITATSSVGSLGADLKINSAGAQSTPWKGEWDDKAGSKPFHAFNYRIHGSAKGTVSLSWDTNQVEIYDWFLIDLNAELASLGQIPVSISNGTLTFPVGLEGQSTSYRIQFYKKSSEVDLDTAVSFNPNASSN